MLTLNNLKGKIGSFISIFFAFFPWLLLHGDSAVCRAKRSCTGRSAPTANPPTIYPMGSAV